MKNPSIQPTICEVRGALRASRWVSGSAPSWRPPGLRAGRALVCRRPAPSANPSMAVLRGASRYSSAYLPRTASPEISDRCATSLGIAVSDRDPPICDFSQRRKVFQKNGALCGPLRGSCARLPIRRKRRQITQAPMAPPAAVAGARGHASDEVIARTGGIGRVADIKSRGSFGGS
jgi:hypothetical protein